MINLLPEREKLELILEERKTLIFILEISVLFFLISLILVLFSIKIYTSSQLDTQKLTLSLGEKIFEESENKIFQEKLDFLNQELLRLNSFYQSQIDLNKILEKISSFLPSGMYLTSFSFSTDNFQVSLVGFSPTREELLLFKKNLEQQNNFSQIYFSPTSWLEPNNFSVNFKVSK